ncbi:hypothetical protein CXX93_19370 (plasmid) [Gordonia sp. YC-JH1]|nr:hypothetical protein CXX93_19370 [Gordonia sp. YC-JH1]
MLGATAHAAPEQGGTTPSAPPEQGGTTPSAPPEQGGTTPSAPPEQGGTTPSAPVPVEPAPSTPGLVPGPPPGPVETVPTAPSYNDDYNPVPSAPLHEPRWVPPVPRKVAPPDHVRIGNMVMPVKDVPFPPGMSKRDRDRAVVSTNDWSAYAEAEIARGLISMGVPKDEASRKAAAAVLGGAAAGAAGGTAAFLATTVTVGLVTVPIGALIGAGAGAVVGGGNPVSIAGGAGLGALGGAGVAVGAGVVVGTAAAAASAVAGGALGYWLGAGDPGADPKKPKLPWEQQGPGKHREPEAVRIVDPNANQYEVHVPAPVAQKAGLPAVDYVVNNRGDVNLTVGATRTGWSAEQAQIPTRAIESVAPGASRAINDGVRAASEELSKAVPGLNVQWPQEPTVAKSKQTARHAR